MTKPRSVSAGHSKTLPHKFISDRNRNRRSWLSGIGVWVVVGIICILAVFAASIAIIPGRINKGQGAVSTVTMQVFDGSGMGNVATILIKALKDFDGSIIYDIAESKNTEKYSFEETILIDRRGSGKGDGNLSEKAKMVAENLGIDISKVLIVRYEDNIQNVDLTLVAGRDYSKYLQKLKEAKEASL